MLLVHPGCGPQSLAPGLGRLPRALPIEEMGLVVDAYRKIAMDAVSAGLEGVELDASGGHLRCSSSRRAAICVRIPMAGTAGTGVGSSSRLCRPCGRRSVRAGSVSASIPSVMQTASLTPSRRPPIPHFLEGFPTQGSPISMLLHRPVRALDTLMLTRGYWSGPIVLAATIDRAKAEAVIASRTIDAIVMGL